MFVSACASRSYFPYDEGPTTDIAGLSSDQIDSVTDPSQAPKSIPDSTPPLPKAPMSIDGAVRFAIRNNPDMELAVARIDQAEAMIDQAEAAFWPALGFYTNYLSGDAPSAYFFSKLDQRDFQFNTNFNDPGTFQNFESGGTVRWNLFHGGRDFLNHELAKTGSKIRRMELESVRNALTASVVRASYSLFAARDYKAIAEQSIKTVAAQLKDTRIKYQGGSALKSDLLSLEARLAEAQAELIRADNQQQAATAALANLLGKNADTPIQLANDIWQPPLLPADYESGLLTALAARPELEKVRHQIVASRLSVAKAQRGYLPNLDLEAHVYYDDENMQYSSDRENWTVGLMFRWDLFTGFSTRSKKRQAEAALHEMLAADRKTVQAVELDVKQAYLTLSEVQARLKAARIGSLRADEALRLVEKEYQGGSASIVRYLEAELAQHRARLAEVRARYDLKQAQANAARALGYFSRPTPAAADAAAQPLPYLDRPNGR